MLSNEMFHLTRMQLALKVSLFVRYVDHTLTLALNLPAIPSVNWHFANEQLARKRGPCSSDMNVLRISG